jgi:site-specific recombinase XerD
MTLSGLMKDCRKYLAMRSYAETTLNTYDERWDAFRAYLVHARLEDDVRSFTGETAMAYAVYLHDRGASGNTICGHLSALRTLAAYGMKTPRRKGSGMMLAADPTTAFDWPTRTQPETKYLLPDELRAFLAVEVPPYMALARDLLMETGLRASEACRLNVEHLREAAGRHFIAVTVKGRGTKERTREVPLSSELAGFIRAEVAPRSRPDLHYRPHRAARRHHALPAVES